ncbi:hypothetical protein HK098_001911 [Nowakowskiella sp. JEL0407]|nr:hypothetical protein HK098_001911 [Nowakowskiella sp. JEL0407]
MPVVFCLRLEDDGSPDYQKKFVRFPSPTDSQPYTLRFTLIAGSTATKNAKLFTNYPVNGSKFDRFSFQSINFQLESISDANADLEIRLPGVYEYYVQYESWETSSVQKSATTGSFIVEPRLYIPSKVAKMTSNVLLPLDGISILTIIPKWMPTVDKWDAFFKYFHHSGYNMVHYAPLNQRGISNSPYSIYDQLALCDELFSDPLSEPEKERVMKLTLDNMYNEYGIMHVTDVVWNHTACNSEWLQYHPEAGFNMKNSPHLRPAYEVDEAILVLSAEIESVHHLPSSITTESELQAVISVFQNTVLPALKLWEYYVIDLTTATTGFLSQWPQTNVPDKYNDISLTGLNEKDRANKFIADVVISDPTYRRLGKTLNLNVAVSFVKKMLRERGWGDDGGKKVFDEVLSLINLLFYQECDADIASIVENTTHRARYLRVADHGPKLGPLSRENPIVDTYFTRLPQNDVTKNHHLDEMALACNGWIWNADPLLNFAGPQSKAYLRREVIAWGDCVKLRYGEKPEDNPWLWNHQREYTEKMARLFHGFRIDNCHSTPINVASYLLDVGRRVRPDLYVFAELFTGSEEKDVLFVAKMGLNSLIREGMNAWDSFELSRLVHRYGGEPVGSLTFPPEHFPLDMLGHCTGSTSFSPVSSSTNFLIDVKGSAPHALFMDCTHDNETPYQKRTAQDTLPHAALVAMANCAVGSVKGFDEIVPHLLNVVTETRKYRVPSEEEGIVPTRRILNGLHAKMAREGYNEVHVHHENGFISVHRVHPQTHDGYLLIARTAFSNDYSNDVHSPIHLRNQWTKLIESSTLRILVNHFVKRASTYIEDLPDAKEDPDESTPAALITQALSTSQLYHHMDPEVVEETATTPPSKRRMSKSKPAGIISGLPCTLEHSSDTTKLVNIRKKVLSDGDFETVIDVNPQHFIPGSIVLLRTWVAGTGFDSSGEKIQGRNSTLLNESDLLSTLWNLLGLNSENEIVELMLKMGWDVLGSGRLWFTAENKSQWPVGLWDAVSNMNSLDINVALFRAGPEERDTIGDGSYDIPGFGELAYCGLQGLVSALQPIARFNDLGHPVFGNLRAGPWLIDYTVSRLEKYSRKFPTLKPFHDWLQQRLQLVKKLGASFIPKYFTYTVMLAYHALKYKALSLSENSVFKKELQISRTSSVQCFTRALALTSFQLYGSVQSTGLFPTTHPSGYDEKTASIAAGLPHFSTNHMRCWGRDIFISLRGLYLLPGHYEAAKSHIIAFGSTLRHGLIPNLLDRGFKPRYNARDATWFWLYAVQEYCRLAPEGFSFLETKVARRFPPLKRYREGWFMQVPESKDDKFMDWYIEPTHPECYKYSSTIAMLCQEILDRHARGIKFREWNAGSGLDHAMRSEGFDIEAGIIWEDNHSSGLGKGFVYGGNRYNCGTWMDKMGDSEKAGIKGIPATPRDGSAIELVGLLKAALRWISNEVVGKVNSTVWPWKGVERKDGKTVTYEEWNGLIQTNFEKHFYVPLDQSQDGGFVLKKPELINRRGIYKDSIGASLEYQDYQLRPNQFISMMVAPELFDLTHAVSALKVAKDALAGPLGIKTLDPADWGYRGVYDNGNDSSDSSVAHGINYHNGPEWVWVYSFFLRAYLHFNRKAQTTSNANFDQSLGSVSKLIIQHKLHILDTKASPYAGLPELTNENGGHCSGSCPTQTWSMATMLELMDDILKI